MPMTEDMSQSPSQFAISFNFGSFGLRTFLLAGLTVLFAAHPSVAAETPAIKAKAAALPSLEQVTGVIESHFDGLKDYEPGDLICRSDAAAALDRVAALGWKVPHRAALEKLILPDDAFLAVQLRSKSGVRFMRKIASLPGGYDRLDRLSGISGGKRIVSDLIDDKGGHKLIEYLATSDGGAHLGKMLAKAKNGTDLNKPTGRIYTVETLVKVVSKLYAEQAARLEAGSLP
jgi:hypothetical protein